MSIKNEAVGHIEMIVSTKDGARYSFTLERDNPHDMTTLGNIQEWLQKPDDGDSYPFPVSRVEERPEGSRRIKFSELAMGSQVFLSKKDISSVLLENHQYLRASKSNAIAKASSSGKNAVDRTILKLRED